MGGDHKCPVCSATFTRPQHVTRHMRSHTGDRPYKCTFCGDQFARSDLLSRHVNKCHAGETLPPAGITRPMSAKRGKGGVVGGARAMTSKQACDQCVQGSLPCDGCNPCSKCISRKVRCTFVKFHRQTAPAGPGHSLPHYVTAMPILGVENSATVIPSSSSLPTTFAIPSQFRFDSEPSGDLGGRYYANEMLRQIEYPPPTLPEDNSSPFYTQQEHHPIQSQRRPLSSSGAPSHLWDAADSQFAYNLPPITQPNSQQPPLRPSSSHSYDPQASSSWGSYSSFDDSRYRCDSSQSSSRPSSSSGSSQFAFSLDGSTNSRPSTRSGYDSRPATRSGDHVDNAFGSLTLDQQQHIEGGSEIFFTSLPDPNATPMPHPEGANIDPIVQHVIQQQQHPAYPPPPSSSSSSDTNNPSELPQSISIPDIPFIPHNPALYALQTQSQSHLPTIPSPTREREQEMKDLREFWRAYMHTPLSQSPGMTPEGSIFMPSNSVSGSESLLQHDFATSSTVATSGGKGMVGNRRQRTNSLPTVKTPLEYSENQQFAALIGDVGPLHQHQQPLHQMGFTDNESGNLTSYQEAVKKRGGGLNLNLSREGSSLLRFRRGSGAASKAPHSSAPPLVTPSHSHQVSTTTRPTFKRLASQILEGSVNKSRRVDE